MISVRLSIAAFLLTATALSITLLEASEFTDEVKRLLASKGPIAPEEDAPGAVDGEITNYYSFHTGQDDPPWWQVDLGESKVVAHVRIYSPHVSERMSKFRLLASGDGHDWETVYEHGKATNDDKRFDVALPNVSTRYLRIAASSRTWMHLDEVMVFGPRGRAEQLRGLVLRSSRRSVMATMKLTKLFLRGRLATRRLILRCDGLAASRALPIGPVVRRLGHRKGIGGSSLTWPGV